MFGAIKAAAIELIQQQVGNVNPKWVYNYEPTLPDGFPAIAVTAFNGDGKFADTQRNRRNYILKIRCYQERDTVGSQKGLIPQEEAERILTALIDQLIAIFDNYPNYNLDNQVQNLVFVEPIPSEWAYAQAPNVNMRVADIKLNAVVVQ